MGRQRQDQGQRPEQAAGVATLLRRDDRGREGTPLLKFDPAALADTTEPGRLWRAGPHGQALPSLRHAIARGRRLVVLTGDAGVGKTIGVNMLVRQLAEDGLTVARVAVPVLDAADLRAAIGLAVGLSGVTTREDLIKAAADCGRIAIVIDDAHAVSDDGLAEVGALLHAIPGSVAVLAGPDTLAARLATPAVGTLATIVPVARRLRPLAEVETELFIEHLLESAGASYDALSRDVIRGIWRTSGGVPRVILHLCRHALESAGPPDRAQLRRWTAEVDESPARDEDAPEMPGVVVLPSQPPARRPWWIAAIGTAVVIVAAIALVAAWPSLRQLRMPTAARTVTVPPSASVPAPTGGQPPVTVPVPAPQPEPSRPSSVVSEEPAPPNITPPAAPVRPRTPTPERRASAPTQSPPSSVPARAEKAAPAPPAAGGDRRTDGSDPTAVIDWLLKER
jgi:type II secretory pathway predicted ATPase ExeA